MRGGSVALLLLTFAGSAAHADEVVDGLRRCAALPGEPERLACYDRLARGLDAALADRFGRTAVVSAPRPAVAARPAPDAAPANAAAAAAALPTAALPTAVRADGEPASLSATINELHQGSRGEWIFRLDNGQLWAQVEPSPAVRFSVGEAIRLERGLFGSLWLRASEHRATKVKRIQ